MNRIKAECLSQLTQPVLYNLLLDPAESRDVAAAHADVVLQMLGLARAARQELGEYMQRGEGNRSRSKGLPSDGKGVLNRRISNTEPQKVEGSDPDLEVFFQ